MWKKFKELGPGILVAAAFIGPGTVTVCTIAGASYGFTLLWAMILSICSTMLLQEMSARLGIVAKKDLAMAVRTSLHSPLLKTLSIALILSAVVIGNAAYEAGNISGGTIGINNLLELQDVQIGEFSVNYFSILIGALAFAFLYSGKYKIIERSLVTGVALMGVSFLVTSILTKPDFLSVISGLFIPKFPENSLFVVVGIIGTTVVPYNLFLHSSLVQEKWKSKRHLKTAQWDSFISIFLGGLVSMTIIITAASFQGSEITSAADLAKGLGPLYGKYASFFIAIGLFAAGTTSAITAPFAAAFVVKGCLDWQVSLNSYKFRFVWMFIIIWGVVLSSLGIHPVKVIIFAQIANGIMLPVITGFLVWITSSKTIMGNYKNSVFQNISGIVLFVVSIILSIRVIWNIYLTNL